MLLVVLLVLIVALVAADVVVSKAAEGGIAKRVQQSGGFATPPEVEVRGRPFLVQVVRGRYRDVVVRATDIPAGELRFASLVTQLSGVQVPLSAVVSGERRPVPVERVSARAVVSYEALTGVVRQRGLRVVPASDGLVRVTGGVQVLGRTLEASAVSRPVLEGSEIVVTAERFEVGNAVADSLLSRALGNRLDFRVALGSLPYGLELTSLRAGSDGVVLTAGATDTVLEPR